MQYIIRKYLYNIRKYLKSRVGQCWKVPSNTSFVYSFVYFVQKLSKKTFKILRNHYLIQKIQKSIQFKILKNHYLIQKIEKPLFNSKYCEIIIKFKKY